MNFKINEDYHLEFNGLYQVRDFKDGCSFFDFDINLDLFKGDHNPQFDISLMIFNFLVFEFRIYSS